MDVRRAKSAYKYTVLGILIENRDVPNEVSEAV